MATAYLWVFIAAAFFSAQFVFSKQFQLHSDGSVAASIWSVELQAIWVLLIFGVINRFQINATPQAFGIALAYTGSNIICSIATIMAISRGKMVTVTMYSMIGGQAVPFIYGILFTGAKPTWLATVGFLLICAASFPNAIQNKKAPAEPEQSPDKEGGLLFMVLCGVVFLGNGLVSVFSDLNAKSPNGAASTDFLIASSLWLFGFGTVYLLVRFFRRRSAAEEKTAVSVFDSLEPDHTVRNLLVVAGIMAAYTVMNSVGNIFSLRAAGVPGMQSSVQFPILNAAIMVMTAVLGRVFFKEKPSRKDYLSLALLIGGILLFLVSFVIYGR